MTNWLIKLCPSSPRELDRLNRVFPAPSHPDEETDRGGTRKKVLPCRRKSVSLHPESMANFPPLHPAQLGFVAFHMGNEWLVGRAHETEPGIGRIIDVDFSKCFPYVFQMLCDILVISMCFIPTPGTRNNNDGHLAVVICFFRVSCSVRCFVPIPLRSILLLPVHGQFLLCPSQKKTKEIPIIQNLLLSLHKQQE